MKSKRSIPNFGEGGFTLLELLVSSALGLAVVAIVLSTFISSRTLVQYDLERTTVTQNLRGALDIIGTQIRLTGENLSSQFPAIEIENGADGSPDELILRRNKLDEVLKLCQNVASGTSNNLYFAVIGTNPGCTYSDQVQNYTAWNNHLIDSPPPLKGYLYDPAIESGQFFEFTSVTDDGSEMYLEISNTLPWQSDYQVGQAAAYIIEEWRFRLVDDVLELIENDDTANPSRIAFGIEDFQLTITLEDGSVLSNFSASDRWTDISSLEVTLSASESAKLQDIERTVSGSFFPRNILSN